MEYDYQDTSSKDMNIISESNMNNEDIDIYNKHENVISILMNEDITTETEGLKEEHQHLQHLILFLSI